MIIGSWIMAVLLICLVAYWVVGMIDNVFHTGILCSFGIHNDKACRHWAQFKDSKVVSYCPNCNKLVVRNNSDSWDVIKKRY